LTACGTHEDRMPTAGASGYGGPKPIDDRISDPGRSFPGAGAGVARERLRRFVQGAPRAGAFMIECSG